MTKITNHAYERAKERLNLNKKALNRLALKAFEKGIRHSETKSKLKRYIDSLYFKDINSNNIPNNIRIYGSHIYIFKRDCLVTMFLIPRKLLKYINLG